MQKNSVRPRKLVKKRQQHPPIYQSIHIANKLSTRNRQSINQSKQKQLIQHPKPHPIHPRKSLQINNTQPVRTLNTLTQLSKPGYRRISYHQNQNNISSLSNSNNNNNNNNSNNNNNNYNYISININNNQINTQKNNNISRRYYDDGEDTQYNGYSQKSNTIHISSSNNNNSTSKYKTTPYIKQSINNINNINNNNNNNNNNNIRTSILNRSNAKINSGNLTKQLSPYQLYKQPRSSLSHHYDPSLQTSLHKRRQSHYLQQKNQILKIAKQYYKDNNFQKCSQFLKKYLKSNPIHNLIQVYYLLGMCQINKGDIDDGIKSLIKTIQLDPYYKKTLYLILALAYKKQQQYQNAINILSKGIQLYPDYYDCIVYRGKMYLKQLLYEKARKDFQHAIHINRNKGFAYLGKGTCEIHLKLTQQAIKTFTLGIQTDLANICYQKRGICYFQLKKYQKSLSDLQQSSLYQNHYSSSLHYYKGLIYFNQHNYTQSLLSFEQCLKCDNSKQLVTLSIQKMLMIKIQDKDFYQAYHIVNRTENLDIEKQVLEQWKMFLEASLFLMKKKYKQGIEMYNLLEQKILYKKQYNTIILESQKQRYKFLKPLIHLYKAFGYLSENKPQKALLQYQYHNALCQQIKISGFNLSKKYNSLIVDATKQFPNNVTELLLQAKQLIPTKPQPYLFIAFDILQKLVKNDNNNNNNNNNKKNDNNDDNNNNNNDDNNDDDISQQNKKINQNQKHFNKNFNKKQQQLSQIIQNLTIGISHLPQLSNNHISSFYYFRSIIQLYKQQFNKAVQDIDKAIQKSEDNIAKYFYLRGSIFACFGNFSQAIQDLTVAINLDQKYAKPYLERAKCLQIEGNSNEAFIDLQKYITLAPEDQFIHKYAGFLLFQNCAYEDCLSAFSHGCDLPNDHQLILTKAKCNFLLGYYSIALQLFKQYQLQSQLLYFQTDIQIIQICHSISLSQSLSHIFISKLDLIIQQNKHQLQQNSKIFKLRDIHQLKGSILLIQKKYDQALDQFNQTLQLFKYEKQKQFQKNIVEDENQFQEEWSQIQIKYNISLCYLCKKEYDIAYEMLQEFTQSTEKGKNWDSYINLIEQLIQNRNNNKRQKLKCISVKQFDTFQQNHRISKLWPRIPLPQHQQQLHLSLAFSYPFVQPPQMLPQFDTDLFSQFDMKFVQPKPQAPWINRNQSGLVFTPNIQIYDNLQLSITTKKNDQNDQNDNQKQISQIQQSISMTNSEFQLQTEDLKKKFKLDSLVEMKLNKILKK